MGNSIQSFLQTRIHPTGKGVAFWFTIWKHWGRLQNKGFLFAELNHTNQSKFGIAYIVLEIWVWSKHQIAVIKLTRMGPPSAFSHKFLGSDKRYQNILDFIWDSPTQTRNTPQPNIATQSGTQDNIMKLSPTNRGCPASHRIVLSKLTEQ